MDTLNPLFSAIHDFFKLYLPGERRSSPHTIKAYRKSLDMLLDYVIAKKNIPLYKVTFKMIDRHILSEFLDHLENERGCSLSTRNHRLQCIRAFYNYAAKEDITAVTHRNEILKVDTAKVPEKLVEHMSEDAVQAVISAPNTETAKGLRDMFLMLFLYKTGARIHEALNVKLRDIQYGKAPAVTLYGKGGKMRCVPLRDNLVQHLKEYVKYVHQGERVDSGQYLFFTVRNGEKKRMTEDNARYFVHEYGVLAREKCAEVPDSVHPHLFRHSCAMSLYRNGVDLTLVSQWLGHSDLETTLVYAHADTELKRKAIEKAIPDDSPLKEHINANRYKISDDDVLKVLCGLK
jgi:site-specific recombinase XerD